MLSATKDILTLLFFRNEGVPKKYMLMGLSSLHASIFSLFITLCDKFHEVHLDYLYMSTKCAHLLYTHQNPVKMQGVCQTGNGEYLGTYYKTVCMIRKHKINNVVRRFLIYAAHISHY